MNEFAVGDKVEVGVSVAGTWVTIRTGVVVAVHLRHCEVDVARGQSAPSVLQESVGSLRKLAPKGGGAFASQRAA